MGKLIYLASTYSVGTESMPRWMAKAHRKGRWFRACQVAAALMNKGHKVFSPIAHSHPIEVYGDTRQDHDFWLEQDFEVLGRCDELLVLKHDKWDESRGIEAEIEFAQARGIPVSFITLEEALK